MNSALFLLNVLALVIFIGFQFHQQAHDPALIHFDAAQSIPAPVARVASSNAQEPGMAAQGVNDAVVVQRIERYTF
jgi:hypothetical protein